MLVEFNGRKFVVKFKFEDCEKIEDSNTNKIIARNNPRKTNCRIYELTGPETRIDISEVAVRNISAVEFSKLAGKRYAMTKALTLGKFTRAERTFFWNAFKAENTSASFSEGKSSKKG
jgi:hypothetical protein